MNYYKRFCGDYARDTAHLSLAEHGAFTLLLDHQYATEKPLPEDYEGLYRLCRAFSADEQKTVRKVADEFFPKCEGGRFNRRAFRQIPEDRAYIDRVRERASKAAHARWDATSNAQALQDAMPATATATANTKANSKKETAASPPDWLPKESWEAFKAHRKALRKPVTELAAKRLWAALDDLRAAGQSVAAILDQSIANGWTGVFALKVNGHANGHAALEAWEEFRRANQAGKKPEKWKHDRTETALEAIGGWYWARFANSRDIDFKQRIFEAAFNGK